MPRVVTIPCRTDNFSFLVGASESSQVAVVDPCDSQPVLDELANHQLELVAILNTHHHGDHVGGNRRLLEEFPGIPVYAHQSDQHRIPGITHPVDDGDRVDAAGIGYRVLFVPGHTNGHIAYYTEGTLFAGDTLFAAGCGRLFEGSPETMNHSLNQKLAPLPDETAVYFAHEYTLSNLRFAATIEPNNPQIQERLSQVRAARASGRWTVPTSIGLEKQTNPFLRVQEPSLVDGLRDRLGEHPTSDQVFANLRSAKDRFR